MIALLDVNVLVALFHAAHIHHDAAHEWFTDNAERGWASCPVTEAGLLRVLSNPARTGEHLPVAGLVDHLNTFCGNSQHTFWPDALTLRDERIFNVGAVRGHQQLTDVYLLGLAVKNGGRFVTLDQRVPLGAVNNATRASLEVIAAGE